MTTEKSPGIEALLIHEPFLRALSGAILRGDDRVDDVIQETSLVALNQSPHDPDAARSWLAKIAGNLSRRLLRRDAARHRFENQERYRAMTLTPSEIAEREETRRKVLDAVMALAEPYRAVILARFYEGLPPREVAKRFDVPVETIRTQTRRGLDRLRDALDEEWMGNRRARILALLPIAGDSIPTGGPPVAAVAAVSLVALCVVVVLIVDRLGLPTPTVPSTSSPVVGTASEPQVPEVPEPDEAERPAPVDWPETDLSRVEPSAYPGMVQVPAGRFTMGLDEEWLRQEFLADRRSIPPLLQGRLKDLWWGILLRETPAHDAQTDAYAIDRYEVTNAQYLAFLDDACRKVVFVDGDRNTIHHVAESLFGKNPTSWELESIYWLNRRKLESSSAKVLADNRSLAREALETFNQDLPPAAWKREFADLPLPNRLDAWVRFELPERLGLLTYTRLVPAHWPQAQPAPGELDHAVRYVSGLDADAFAEWAGKHIPTEAEWEKAARGPRNTVYPWGNEWVSDDPVQKNLLVWNGADSPPKSPNGDRPGSVAVCPEGRSDYGCFNMLGNVMEWTSSPPLRYPRSDARFAYWGKKGARVLRGQSFGGGKSFKSKELEIRATARIVEGPDGAVDERNLYSVLGFRCAKYHAPARDLLGHRLKALERTGVVPPGLRFDPRAAFGIERLDYDAAAEDMAYVRHAAMAIGLVPVAPVGGELPAGPAEGDRVLGLLYWSPGLSVEVELPGGEREQLASSEFGFYLVVRKSRLALFHPTLSGMEFVGHLPSSDVERLTTPVQAGNHGHRAHFGKTGEPGNLTLGLGRGMWVRGERLEIPLHVSYPYHALGEFRTGHDGR